MEAQNILHKLYEDIVYSLLNTVKTGVHNV
nr:MAG TPA: hypothetical protein [Caudoviricetes sp.]